jgi:hypothetical protein
MQLCKQQLYKQLQQKADNDKIASIFDLVLNPPDMVWGQYGCKTNL